MDNSVEKKHCSFCGLKGRRGMRFAGGLGAMMCEGCVRHYCDVFDSPAKLESSARAPWHQMSDAEVLGNLPLIAQTATEVSDFLVEWVELARSRKLSWAEIGKAMGISRQGAWERFSQRVEALQNNTAV